MTGKEEPPFPICTDTSDCIELSFTSGLYLKPITKLSITVTIPHLKSGQAIANKEIIDKLRIAIRPDKFASIKATKYNLEFLRFDAELDNKKKAEFVINKIDQKGLKLTGFTEVLKIRATEGKIPFPSRHDWDSYFKEAKHMNEKKPGERPDTVHIKSMPCEWFIHNDDPSGACPSEYVVSKVFSSFGEIRALDIPCLDPYRKQMSAIISGVNKFSFTEGRLFDVYVQYKEYIGFAKCMHTLQAKKLVIQRDETVYMADIRVDFDKTKHLSDASMKRREIEREKIMSTSIHLQEKSRMKKEISLMKKDAEKIERYNAEEKERKRVQEREDRKKGKEEKRKRKEIKKRLKKLMAKHEDLNDFDDIEAKLTKKLSIEERKMVVAQRCVEAVRLFEKIFDRIKTYHQKETAIKTTMRASGIQSEPLIFGHWFNAHCQILTDRKKFLYEEFLSMKTNENWLHYKKCSHKLKKAAHNQKLKFIGSCLKNVKGINTKELDERKRKELMSCKKVIKLSKARQLDQMQAQQRRLDKVTRGKIQVIFLPCDDENKVALSPASSGSSSSSSASAVSDESDSDKEKKVFGGKMRSDQHEGQDFYGNQGNQEHFQGGHYYHHNYRPRGSYGMGQPFPYDNRGRGFRFYRPYFPRGFRGGPHQGFENRGRGFYQFRGRFPYDKSRGRGGYIDYKKMNEHPIQLGSEKWFKRGNGEDEEEEPYFKPKFFNKYEKSEQWSPSLSDSRSGSRKRSRSWSDSRSGSRKRSRVFSASRSGSRNRSPSLSVSRSASRKRSPSWSGSKSSPRKRSPSWSDDKSSPRKRSPSWSDNKSSPRKFSRSWSRSRSRSYSRSRYESEKSPRYTKHETRRSNDFRERGRSPRKIYTFRGNPRQRRPRGSWRGRGRGHFNNNYNQSDHEEEYNEQYVNLYKKYFNRIKEKAKHDGHNKDRKKDQVVDMNARYREEEERARADIIQQQVKKSNKRHRKV